MSNNPPSQAEKIKAIKAWVLDANPELMELKLGCRVSFYTSDFAKRHDGEHGADLKEYVTLDDRYSTAGNGMVRIQFHNEYWHQDEYKIHQILGSNPTLHNVLRALDNDIEYYQPLLSKWNLNLADDLETQLEGSTELCDFLYQFALDSLTPTT